MSCLTNAVLHDPSGLRIELPDLNSHVYAVVEAFFMHEDPMVRGNVYQLLGNSIRSSLERLNFAFGKVPRLRPSDSTVSAHADVIGTGSSEHTDHDGEAKVLSLHAQCAMLADAILDETTTCARQACQAVRTCLPALLLSTRAEYGVELLSRLLSLKDNSYWLLKVEVLGVIQELDFVLLAHLEESLPYHRRADIFPECHVTNPCHPLGQSWPLQEKIIDAVVTMLDDSDERLRAAATDCLVKLVPRLYYPVDRPVHDALTILAERRSTALLRRTLSRELQHSSATIATATTACLAPDHEKSSHENLTVCRANLSRLVQLLVCRLHASQNRTTLMGCYHALDVLSSAETWPPALRLPLPGVQTVTAAAVPVFVTDIIPLALDHLRVAWMSLELGVHVSMLGLVGNLSQDAPQNLFQPYAGQLLSHVLRVLNICVHIVTNAPVTASKSASSLKASTKTKSAGAASPASSGGRVSTEPGGAPGVEVDERELPHGAPLGHFVHLPHYMKLHETMQGAFKAGSISLSSADDTSKFGNMVRSSLEVLAVVVQCQGAEFKDYAKEALGYMNVLIVTEPRAVLLCVYQLLGALFGLSDDDETEAGQSRADNDCQAEPTILLSKPDGFFERCIKPTRPASRQPSPSEILGASRGVSEVDTSPGPPSGLLNEKSSNKKADPSAKATMYSLIGLFEPLVVRAMNLYTTTSSIPLQQQILELLSRLLLLRVNYSMLDSDRLFAKSLIKQLTLIENGHVRGAHKLLGSLFRFLTLLSADHHKLSEVISIPRVIQLADGLLASTAMARRLALPALAPIVQELFLSKAARQPVRPQRETELGIMREVVVNTLMKHLQHPPVWELLTSLLKVFKSDDDKWRSFSRKIVDSLLQLLSSGEVVVKHSRTLAALDELFASFAPVSLRPAGILIGCIVTTSRSHLIIGEPRSWERVDGSRHMSVTLPISAPTDGVEADDTSWSPTVLIMLQCLALESETALLSALSSIISDQCPMPPEEAFVKFLFEMLAVLAGRIKDGGDFAIQEIVRFMQTMYALICDDKTHPQLFAAARGCGRDISARIGDQLSETVLTNPMIVSYWTQLLVHLGCVEHEQWVAVCGLQDPSNLNANQQIARRAIFLLRFERTAVALRGDEAKVAMRTHVLANNDSWFEVLLMLADETPVRDLVDAASLTLNQNPDLTLEFVKRVTAVLEQIEFQEIPAKQQVVVINLLRRLPPTVAYLEMLIGTMLPTQRFSTRVFIDSIAASALDVIATSSSVDNIKLTGLFELLISKIQRLSSCPATVASFSRLGLELPDSTTTIQQLKDVDPVDWHFGFVKRCCRRSSRIGRSDSASCELLLSLTPESSAAVVSSMEFDYALLRPCLALRLSHKKNKWAMGYATTSDKSGASGDVGLGVRDGREADGDQEDEEPRTEPWELAAAAKSRLIWLLSLYCQSSERVIGTRGTTVVPSSVDARSEADTALTIGDRATLSDALAEYLSPAIAAPDEAPPTVTTDEMESMLSFARISLELVARPTCKIACSEIQAILDGVAAVMGHPALSEYVIVGKVDGSSANHDKAIAAMIFMVSDLYRLFSVHPPLMVRIKSIDDQSGGDVPANADGFGDGSADSITGIGMAAQHQLCRLVQELDRGLQISPVHRLRDGSSETAHRFPLQPSIANALRKITIGLARLSLRSVHHYGVLINPDTGALPRTLGPDFEELGMCMRRPVCVSFAWYLLVGLLCKADDWCLFADPNRES